MPQPCLCAEIRDMPNTRIAPQEVTMSEPFIHIASYQIKPGALDEARRRLREVAALVEGRHPRPPGRLAVRRRRRPRLSRAR